MRQWFYLLPLLMLSLASVNFTLNESVNQYQPLNLIQTATPTPEKLEESDEIILDKKAVCHPCPQGYRCLPNPDCPDDNSNMIIAVSSVKPENGQLKYEYTVSGGRVTGEGAKVFWDLTGAQPGTYQIRVNVKNKSTGKKQTETETITVNSFIDGADCFCPALSVKAAKSPIKAGETMTFIANVDGGGIDAVSEITYKWKVSDGEIIEGQGTPVIRVATNSKTAGKTIKATVEIEGVCDECPKTESAEVFISGATNEK